jgi:hypothetical protein
MNNSSTIPAPAPVASEVDNAARATLARLGIDPDQLLDRNATGEMLTRAGFRCGRQSLAKAAGTRVDGPAYQIAFGRAIERAGDALAWAIGRAQKPKDGPQMQTARARRERGDVFNPKRRAELREATAA